MEKELKSLDAEFFNKMYQKNEDPWDFENSPYEKEKYKATLEIIPDRSYDNVFEIGCSNGMLSEMLLSRSNHLLAVDASAIAVKNAKQRMKDYPFVKVMEMTIPYGYPDEKFDLILLSEVGYFLNEEDLIIARDKMIESLLPNGNLALVHWTPFVEEFPLTGDQVHEIFRQRSGEDFQKPLAHILERIEIQYRMDLYEKR